MKTTSRKVASGALMALCLNLGGGLYGADQAYDLNKPRGDYETKQSISTVSPPARFNKASCLVGMDVRNHKNERLGEIKDVVIDLKSERVAYAVLGTGGLLHRPKLVAVPLNAFTASADDRYLILRADKSKLEMATGIERDNWPAVNNPSWGAETFWEQPARPGVIDKTDKFPDLKPKPEAIPDVKPDQPDQNAKPGQYDPTPERETKPEQK